MAGGVIHSASPDDGKASAIVPLCLAKLAGTLLVIWSPVAAIAVATLYTGRR